MNQDILTRACARIGALTPMLRDCGALCGAACCQTDADGQGGVYLFPGEAARLRDCGWVARIEPGGFAPVMICDGTCDREKRPLGCRIFPLTPVRGKNGRWTVRLDARARAMCPLVASGIGGLDPAFVKAARDALRIVAGDPEGEAFLEKWYALEEAYRQPLW
ncbi:MAG: hypothetical protein IJH86_08585 [Clostridia bacterium]|nr:hypothetical protein [Clostridia bacterium]